MSVWILLSLSENECADIEGVFATKELAEAYLADVQKEIGEYKQRWEAWREAGCTGSMPRPPDSISWGAQNWSITEHTVKSK